MGSKEVNAPWGLDSCILKDMAGVPSSRTWE